MNQSSQLLGFAALNTRLGEGYLSSLDILYSSPSLRIGLDHVFESQPEEVPVACATVLGSPHDAIAL